MKIGRREHLRQLGFGAAGLLGTGLFENDLSRISKANPRVLPRIKARAWPWTSSAPTPDNPGIRMLFAGMMVFTYKGRQGRVVFHTGTPHHNLEIVAYEKGTPCVQKLRKEGANIPPRVDLISPGADDVQYFQSGDPDNFDRKIWDNKDFRWLLDLEGPETYGNRDFDRTEDKGFNKKLHVKTGTFYTYQRTNSTFKTDVGSLMCSEFSVARIMACDIRIPAGQTFVFKVGGDEVRMQNPSKYEIHFLNTCRTCTTSDFDMVFDAIRNGEDYKFGLTLATQRGGSPLNDICDPVIAKGNDEAPCMGAAFGGGLGFP